MWAVCTWSKCDVYLGKRAMWYLKLENRCEIVIVNTNNMTWTFEQREEKTHGG